MKNQKAIGGYLLAGAALLGAYALYKSATAPREASGSLGGTDDLLEQQGFDIDPNAIPQQKGDTYNTFNFINTPEDIDDTDDKDQVQTNDDTNLDVLPDGKVVPTDKTNFPSNVPIASTGTGTLFQDASAVSGSIGANLMLPVIAKRVNKLIDTKYISEGIYNLKDLPTKQSPFKKLISDPYNIQDLAVSKAEKAGTREIAELSIGAGEKTVVKTIPKWAKGVKTVANFIPILDIPIGSGLDVYFSRYESDPSKKIDWWSAIKANTAGELAQIGVTGGGAALGSVVPIAGTVSGGVSGFVVGTGADIATTELYYKKMGKSSLFDTSKPAANTGNSAQQASVMLNTLQTLGIKSTPTPSAKVSSPQSSANFTANTLNPQSMNVSTSTNTAPKIVSVTNTGSSSKVSTPTTASASQSYAGSGGKTYSTAAAAVKSGGTGQVTATQKYVAPAKVVVTKPKVSVKKK